MDRRRNPPPTPDETSPVNHDSTSGRTKVPQIQPAQTIWVKCGEQMRHFSSAFPQVLFIFFLIVLAIGVKKTRSNRQ